MDQLGDTCAIELRLELPRALAEEVVRVQRRDPEALARILQYGLARRTIYHSLARESR